MPRYYFVNSEFSFFTSGIQEIQGKTYPAK